MSTDEKISVKLYAVSVNPAVRYISNRGTIYLTDVSLAISHSPTLSALTGLKSEEILSNADYSGGIRSRTDYAKLYRRIIEYPKSDKLSVTEIVNKYRYESPVPRWIGWILGVAVAEATIHFLSSFGVFQYFSSWFVWLLIFFPIGYGWERIFSDRKYYLSEILISGDKDYVLKFISEVRNNLGRPPIMVLKASELKRFSEATGMDPVGLEEMWDKITWTK